MDTITIQMFAQNVMLPVKLVLEINKKIAKHAVKDSLKLIIFAKLVVKLDSI